MILVWMAYAILVAALGGLAALVAEPITRGRGAPTRFLWLGSIALSIALPLWSALAPPPAPTLEAARPTGAFFMDVGVSLREIGRAAPSLLHRLNGTVAVAWGVASALLGLSLLGGLARLAARARKWPRTRVGDQEVLVSEDFGPAVLGGRAPRVVLPSWALALDAERLGLVVAHEREHERAGDPRLLLAGAAALVLAPWNPALWWQLSRLRAAVEMDCDHRVLRAGAAPDVYGRLLLDLGARAHGAPLPVPGLARPRSLLERRMKMIVRGARRTGILGTGSGAVGAALLLVAACETPSPTAVRPVSQEGVAGSIEIAPEAPLLGEVTVRTSEVDPILYLDGVRVERLPEGLAPEGVARVEVLKGEAARALVGEEAAGGIVRVFTKQPAASGSQPRSIVAAANVLVLLDGAPYRGDIAEIRPDMIDRVDVLRGPEGPSEIHITSKKPGGGL